MRPSRDQWALALAFITAERATCLRRKVGAVFLNARGHVLATGYNGVAAGLKHCNEVVMVGEDFRQFGADPKVQKPERMVESYPNACPGAQAKSGTLLDQCGAIHAEQNALLQCRDVYEIHTCYVTVSPCVTCTKLLMNTSCERIVFVEEYVHNLFAYELWTQKRGRTWEKLSLPGT